MFTNKGSISRRTNDEGDEESTEVTRFDSNQAFIFLFAVSFGPAFIVVDLATTNYSDTDKGFYIVNSILLVFILLTFISNAVSVTMLTRV